MMQPVNEKLLRALHRGGQACWRDGMWCVRRAQDRRGRVIGELTPAQANSMLATGDLREAQQGVLVWNGAAPSVAGRSRAPSIAETRRPSRTGLEIVLETFDNPQTRASVRAAASRLAGDAERAAAGQRVTQNWDTSLHVDGAGQGGQKEGRLYASVRASRRLAAIRGRLTDAEWTALMRLVVEQRTLAALAREQSLSRNETASRLAQMLVRLAEAYRLSTRSDG